MLVQVDHVDHRVQLVCEREHGLRFEIAHRGQLEHRGHVQQECEHEQGLLCST